MHALIKVKAHPSARENRIERRGPDSFEIWVKAEAEAGRANHAALALLATALHCEPKRLFIVKGAASTSKIVRVLGTLLKNS